MDCGGCEGEFEISGDEAQSMRRTLLRFLKERSERPDMEDVFAFSLCDYLGLASYKIYVSPL